MQYVYDGRGSVAQALATVPGASKPDEVSSSIYTPFGEMLSGKQTGFGFNAEWYDAATGMQNLRARQYEPAMMRFSQKDIVRGQMTKPLSLNRYAYVQNDPINFIDPSGMILAAVKKAVEPLVKVATAVATAKAKLTNVFSPAQSAANHAKAATLGPEAPFSIAQRNASPKLEAAYQAALKDPKNAHLPEAEKMRAAFAQACAKVTNNYEAYWNRKDGYFSGDDAGLQWYSNQSKMDEAAIVLMAEAMAGDDGKLAFNDLALRPSETNRLHAMQALVGSAVINSTWDDFYDLKNRTREQLYLIHGDVDIFFADINGLTAKQISDIYGNVRDTRDWHQMAAYNLMGGMIVEGAAGSTFMMIAGTPLQQATLPPKVPVSRATSVDNFIKENVNPNFQQSVKEAFTSDVKVTTLPKDTIAYRYNSEQGTISYWYTPNKTANPAADLALHPSNTHNFVDVFTIPGGTTILEGGVAPNFGQPGGGYQFYVPNPSVVLPGGM